MDVLGLTVSMTFSLGACVGGGWWCIKRLSEARFLLNTPTSKIRSAAQGYVELYGVLRVLDEGQVSARLTGTPCLWWRFRVERFEREGKQRRWRVIDSGVSSAWLRLQDATGECLINPTGAEVRPVVRQVWYDAGQYRYTEERLHDGQPLYAIGDFRTHGGVQAFDLDQAQGAVVREWKSDFAGLLQRFDTDGDGQLSESEWQRMRESARAEAQRRELGRGEPEVQHQLQRPQESYPFILSNYGEDELARSFYWQAAGGALFCLAGALATAWLVANILLPALG